MRMCQRIKKGFLAKKRIKKVIRGVLEALYALLYVVYQPDRHWHQGQPTCTLSCISLSVMVPRLPEEGWGVGWGRERAGGDGEMKTGNQTRTQLVGC